MEHQHVNQRHYIHATFRADSAAASALAKRTGASTTAIAGGFAKHPEMNLSFHGGRTIPALSYYNFFVGGNTAWMDSDVTNINTALASATQDTNLNNVLQQYFAHARVTSTPLGSRILAGSAPHAFNKTDVENAVSKLAADGTLAGVAANVDLSSTVFNFMLPRGTLLFSDTKSSGNEMGTRDGVDDDSAARRTASKPSVLEEGELREEEDSLHGLGGYHGSVRLQGGKFAYYAIGVYSEFLTSTRANGIPAFDKSWKDVVATFYHELCEARTDPDVEEVNRTNNDSLLGWYSDKFGEIGDIPMELAGSQLNLVMQEVPLANGHGTVPVQLEWSNAVGGAEGPISAPH